MVKKILLFLILCGTVNANIQYTQEFQNGLNVETFIVYDKIYVGPPFLDTVINPNCEVLDTIDGGTISLSWTAPGDDGYTGTANKYEGFFGDSVSVSNTTSQKFIIPNPQVAGSHEFITLVLDKNQQYYFAVRTKDEVGNLSELSNITQGVTSPIFYKQIYYIQDTSYVTLKTYPDTSAIPNNIVQFNGLGIETGYINFKSNTTIHISPMRRKDNSMDNSVDLTDLSLLIGYLTGWSNVDTTQAPIAVESQLNQNYPNPFNPSTNIEFSLQKAGNVKITVYNIMGQTVKTLINETKPAGKHIISWDGKDYVGEQVASGLYFYRLESNQQIYTKKMLLLK